MNPRPLQGKTVLVVDDEEGYREVLADEFEMAGATVVSAENGNRAFEIFKEQHVDVVISDVRMPNGSGVEFLDRVRAINSKTPVVMLITGFSDLAIEEAYDKGADAIFSKPCNLDTLIESVLHTLLPEKDRWVKDLVPLPSSLCIELKIESMEIAIKAQVLNIGRGGMFVAFDGAPIDVEEIVVFRAQFPKGAQSLFEGQGICRWFRHLAGPDLPRGVGIEFTTLTEQSLQILLALLKKLKPKAFIPKGPVLK